MPRNSTHPDFEKDDSALGPDSPSNEAAESKEKQETEPKKEKGAKKETKSSKKSDAERSREMLDRVIEDLKTNDKKVMKEMAEVADLKLRLTKMTAKEKKRQKRRNEQYEIRRNQVAKAKAFALEEENDRWLILFRSTNNFWKMGGVSALEFYYHLAPRLGRMNTRLLSDTDFRDKFPHGVVSINNLRVLEKQLDDVNIHLAEEDDCLKIYALGYIVGPEDIKWMQNEMNAIHEQANRNITPVEAFPEIRYRCGNLIKFAVNKTGRMSQQQMAIYGQGLNKETQMMILEYYKICNGDSDPVDGLLNIYKVLKTMLRMTVVPLETAIFSPQDCMELQMMIIDLMHIIRKELIKLNVSGDTIDHQ